MDPKNRLNHDAERVQGNIDKVRRRGFQLRDDHVTSAHGAGGKASAALVEHVFFAGYGNDALRRADDASLISATPELTGALADGGQLAMSTDSYVVNPIEFPGGSIGDLAVNGTVNDLAVTGARPLGLSAAFVLEEGLAIEELRRVVDAVRAAAEAAGVPVITGDTKVVPRGAADKLYITTAGVGVVPAGRRLGTEEVRPGDVVLVSGPIADHGMSVMMARGDLAISAPIESDSRALNHTIEAMLTAVNGTRFLRDATRGGLATSLNELALAAGVSVHLDDSAIPVREMTRAACDMLGIDPLYVANEGTFVAVVAPDDADAALAALHDSGSPDARRIGTIEPDPAGTVVLRTAFGGTRMVDMLVGDPLPRIC